MRLSSFLAILLALNYTTSQSCQADPSLSKALASCTIITPFCTSLLGRTTPATITVTTTAPKRTLTSKKVKTKTVRSFVTLSLTTSGITSVSCVPRTYSTEAAKLALVRERDTPCETGEYPLSAVSEACSCFLPPATSTTTITKTRKSGTIVLKTTKTKTAYVTSTRYVSTATATQTLLSNNCYPPSNASCLTPKACGEYDFYLCGFRYDSQCACGFDSHDDGTCFVGASCDNKQCAHDYDCQDGEACLYQSCCATPVCAQVDVCIGDVGNVDLVRTAATVTDSEMFRDAEPAT